MLEANRRDVERAQATDVAGRRWSTACGWTLARVDAMASGLRQVAALADPVGQVLDGWVRPNGLRIERVRVPLGRSGHHL